MAEGDAIVGFHLNEGRPQREEIGLEQPGDGARVMQRRAVAAGVIGLDGVGEAHDGGGGLRPRRVDGLQRVDALRQGEHLIGDVEPEDRDGAAGVQHLLKGMRVGIDVVLGRGGDVAAGAARPAHDHDLSQARADIRRKAERQRHIGGGPGDGQRDGVRRLAADRIDDELRGIVAGQRHVGLDDRNGADAARSVEIARLDRIAQQRTRGPRIDRNLGTVRDLADEAGVAGGAFQPRIPGDRGDAENVERLAGREGQQQRHGVVDAGVAIDDQLDRSHALRTSPASCRNCRRRRA